jgi:hypothetical protein
MCDAILRRDINHLDRCLNICGTVVKAKEKVVMDVDHEP